MATAVLLGVTACSSSRTSPGKNSTTSSPIVIGNVGSYSGAQASSEAGAEHITKAWAKRVSAPGGIRGRQVNLIDKDDQNVSAAGLPAVKELVQQDHAVAIVGE